MSDLPEAVFRPDGEWLVPTDLARGPWHEDSQHGSAMSGLLARALERAPSVRPMQLTRLTIDLVRSAPFARVRTRVGTRHAGKSVEVLEAELLSEQGVCARAHAVRTRIEPRALPAEVNDPLEALPLDPTARVPLPRGKTLALHDALWLSPVNAFAQPAMWVRMLRPLVAGEPDSPAVRLCVALDWVYACVSLSQWSRDLERLQRRPFMAINTDNHVALQRPIEGEWVLLDASACYGELGAGVAQARVCDAHGLVGFATQGLLLRGLDKRPKAWREAD
jgi:hypothetical protein